MIFLLSVYRQAGSADHGGLDIEIAANDLLDSGRF